MSYPKGTLFQALPPRLRERARIARSSEILASCSSQYVLYWQRNTLRAHENPALDTAVHLANSLSQPLRILLEVDDQYPHSTPRYQLFKLEGARECVAEYSKRGLGENVVFHVGRWLHSDSGKRAESPLPQLIQSASVVVAEEPFCVPWLEGIERLSRALPPAAALWLVDTACVVPCQLVPEDACHRAWQYEKATKDFLNARINLEWDEYALQRPGSASKNPEQTLGAFDSCFSASQGAAFSDEDLFNLVLSMERSFETEIQKSAKPVSHLTAGGSSPGYRRWTAWLSRGGLKTYAKTRNEALDPLSVSRMSAYLNLGMVSPFRLARQVFRSSGSGKQKFMNEFLTWRGVSYAWCYHIQMPSSGATTAQLPAWAKQTLEKHRQDPRPVNVAAERMAGGATGFNRAWDALQQYMVFL